MIQVLMINVMAMANSCRFMRYGTGQAAVLRLKSTPEVQVWQGLRLAAQGQCLLSRSYVFIYVLSCARVCCSCFLCRFLPTLRRKP